MALDLSGLYALLAGGLAGGGALLLVVALRGLPSRPAAPGERRSGLLGVLTQRGSVAALAGVLTLVVTRWPIAAIGAALLTLTWHGLLGGASEERTSIARIEALASWTESLRDTIAGAVGLEQAIPASLRAAAPVLQWPLRSLVDRLREVLTSLSKSAREELDMRRRVVGQRRSTRRSVQIVVGVTLLMVVALVLFNRSYVEPYATVEGQLVLIFVLLLFAGGFVWLKRLSGFETPGRFLFGGGVVVERRQAARLGEGAQASGASRGGAR